LGGFGSGANVSALRPDGSAIGAAKTGADGKATVDFGTYDGPFILKVVGGEGVTYYNEKSGISEPFGATDTLLSVVPTSTVAPGAAFGVNPLTHMVAAAAGITPTAPKIEAANVAAVIATINEAKGQVYKVLGIPETALDILAAPVMVTATTTTINASSTAGTLGLLLAEMAKAATGNPLQQAQQLFTAVSAAKAAGFQGTAAAASLQIVVNQTAVATTAVASGQSSFAAAGSAVPATLTTVLSTAAQTAASSVTASTGITVTPPATTPGSSTSTTSSTSSTTSTTTSGGSSVTYCTAVTLNSSGVFKMAKGTTVTKSFSELEKLLVAAKSPSGCTLGISTVTVASGSSSIAGATVTGSSVAIEGKAYGAASLTLTTVGGVSQSFTLNVYLPDSEASGSGSGSGSGSASGAPFGG
jgi:hypothetical protein